MSERLRKIDRLRIAGVVAPHLRDGNERRVAIVNASGTVVGYRTLGEVQRQIMTRAKIEFDSVAPHKLSRAICRACGRRFGVKSKNRSAKYCPGGCETSCVDCLTTLRVHRKRYEVGDVRCKKCSARAALASLSTEQRAAVAQKQAESLRKRFERMSPEERAAATAGIRRPRSRDPRCSVCGATLPYNVMAPSQVKRRNGRPPRCAACRAKKLAPPIVPPVCPDTARREDVADDADS